MSGFPDKKIELASSSNPSVLAGFINEKNPVILAALFENPLLPVDTVLQLIRKKAVNEEHIFAIVANKKWHNDYIVKLELILYPVTPRTISLKFMKDMKLRDLAVISRRVSIHPSLREVAVNYLRLRLETMRTGEKISLARTASVAFLLQLLNDPDDRVFCEVLKNFRLTEEDVIQFITPSSRSAHKLDLIVADTKWSRNQNILKVLSSHPNLGYATRQMVFQHILLPLLIELTDSPVLDQNHIVLAIFSTKQRLMKLSLEEQIRIAGSPSRRVLFFLGSVMKAPAVVRSWLKNPAVTEKLCNQCARENSDPNVVQWINNRQVPRKPEQGREVTE